jgi:hypothetical protein
MLTASVAGVALAVSGYAIEGSAPRQEDIVMLGAAWLAGCAMIAAVAAALTLVMHARLQKMEMYGLATYLLGALAATLAATIPFPMINCPARCEYDVCSECGAIGWTTYFLAVFFAGATTGAWFWFIRRPDRDKANPGTGAQ